MNQDQELPEDAVRNVENVLDSESCAAIERLLKSAQPRPPRLDLAVIERLARQVPAQSNCPSLDIEPHVAVTPRISRHGQRRRPYAAIAGSWICGALVGTVCMSWFERHSAPTVDRNEQTFQVAEDPPRVVTTDRNATPNSLNGQLDANASVISSDKYSVLSDTDSRMFPALLDLNGRIGSRNERAGGTLRARMHLAGLAETSWRGPRETIVQKDSSKDNVTSPNTGLIPDRDMLRDSPPVTRGWLLRELQEDSARRFL